MSVNIGIAVLYNFFSSGSGTDSPVEIAAITPPVKSTSPLSVDKVIISDTSPQGKILSPATGIITGNEVTVICETKNLEPGTRVWLAVDKPDIGLC